MAVVDSAPPVAKKRAYKSKTETVTDNKGRKIVREANIAHSSKTETVTETERLEILRQENIAAVQRVLHIIETTLDQRQKVCFKFFKFPSVVYVWIDLAHW